MNSTLERYRNYTFIIGNRHVNRTFVNRLRRQLEKNEGRVPNTVEWIVTVNSRKQIIDGQCHWQAVMDYNERHPKNQIQSIVVIVEPDAGLERAKEINNTKTGWKEKDYFDSYIDLGHTDYITLRRIRQTPAGRICGLTTVLQVCGYLENVYALRDFKRGEFEMIRDESDAMEMLGHIAACKSALVENFGDRNIAPIVFARCLLIPGINKAHLVDRVSHPVVTARGFRYSTNEMNIVNNIHVLYNRELTNTDVKHLDIYNLYRDVQSHNWQNMRSARRPPNRRPNPPTPPNPPAGGAALRVPHGNATPRPSRRHNLRDDGVVPV